MKQIWNIEKETEPALSFGQITEVSATLVVEQDDRLTRKIMAIAMGAALASKVSRLIEDLSTLSMVDLPIANVLSVNQVCVNNHRTHYKSLCTGSLTPMDVESGWVVNT